jgi:transposase
MAVGFRTSSLIPPGLAIESIICANEAVIVTARADAEHGVCPLCRATSRQVHSRYVRRVADLPWSGRGVQLRLVTRRFVCAAALCRRRIFAERFAAPAVAERARRTGRLEHVVHHLGLALGGRPAASFAARLMLPVSRDTLLRVVRRRATPPTEPVTVAGIDDWAWRRNHRYGTIVCDLKRRRIAKPGWAAIQRSVCWRVIAVVAMARPPRGPHRRRCRLPTAGT